jgi:hypothetical protein
MILIKAWWFKEVYRSKLIYILDLALTNFFFITKFYLLKSCKIHLLIILTNYIRKPSSVGVIKRTNLRKESLSITINIIYIYIIYFRSNHLNFSILIQETNTLYVACKAMAIIIVTEGVGKEKGISDKVITPLISLSFSSLRLIQYIFNR